MKLKEETLIDEDQYNELQAEFQSICNHFFPRWRAARFWKVEAGSRGQYKVAVSNVKRGATDDSLLDFNAKTIWLMPSLLPEVRRYVLVQECAHIVAGHGKRLAARLLRAAKRAESLGDKQLGWLLYLEVELLGEST